MNKRNIFLNDLMERIVNYGRANQCAPVTKKDIKFFFFMMAIIVFCLFWIGFGFQFICQTREYLPSEYAEVFATPMQDVQITDYWNARAGHGKRFSMVVKSPVPLQLRNPAAFKETSLDADWDLFSRDIQFNHPDWGSHFSVLRNETAGISIGFNQSRTVCEVRASIHPKQINHRPRGRVHDKLFSQ